MPLEDRSVNLSYEIGRRNLEDENTVKERYWSKKRAKYTKLEEN